MEDQSEVGDESMISTNAASDAGGPTVGWQPGESLTIAVDRSQPAATVIALDGELDSSTSPQLTEALANTIRPGTCVVVELDGLKFIGSAGISALLTATEHADEVGGTLRLVVAPGNRVVGRPLTITGLASALSVVPDLASALRPSR